MYGLAAEFGQAHWFSGFLFLITGTLWACERKGYTVDELLTFVPNYFLAVGLSLLAFEAALGGALHAFLPEKVQNIPVTRQIMAVAWISWCKIFLEMIAVSCFVVSHHRFTAKEAQKFRETCH